jgi:mobilization protein NikA
MARDLTIQIRLTKEEHDTIAAQAGREGLGVGTYLRTLALRNAFESSGTPRGRAFAALRRAQERSKTRGLDRLSAKDIDAEIKAARATRGRRG